MKVLVTGGCGYIGARLVPFLLADGHHVTVMDTKWFGSGHLPDNENCAFVQADIRDEAEYRKVSGGQDAVIWLASVSNNDMYGGDSMTRALTHDVNTTVWHTKGQKFLYASSAAVLDPTSDYAKDKLACEERLKDTGAIIVRAASACGYSANQRFDTTLNMMTHDAARKGVITVNGGEQRRAHIHLDDLCDFYRLALGKAVDGETYTVFNIGMTVKYAAEKVVDVFKWIGKSVSIDLKPRSDNRNWPELNGDSMRSIGAKTARSVWDGVRDMAVRLDADYWPDSATNLLYRRLLG